MAGRGLAIPPRRPFYRHLRHPPRPRWGGSGTTISELTAGGGPTGVSVGGAAAAADTRAAAGVGLPPRTRATRKDGGCALLRHGAEPDCSAAADGAGGTTAAAAADGGALAEVSGDPAPAATSAVLFVGVTAVAATGGRGAAMVVAGTVAAVAATIAAAGRGGDGGRQGRAAGRVGPIPSCRPPRRHPDGRRHPPR